MAKADVRRFRTLELDLATRELRKGGALVKHVGHPLSSDGATGLIIICLPHAGAAGLLPGMMQFMFLRASAFALVAAGLVHAADPQQLQFNIKWVNLPT